MAIDARGWRRLVVGEQTFFWQTGEGSDVWGFLLVRPSDQPHRLLRVSCQPHTPRELNRVVGPSVAREAVQIAAALGWPGERTHLRLFAFSNYVAVDNLSYYTWRFVGLQPSWLTPTVTALVAAIDAERAYDRLPILADALEEAGCDSVDLLRGCRSDWAQYGGSWMMELLLGKQ